MCPRSQCQVARPITGTSSRPLVLGPLVELLFLDTRLPMHACIHSFIGLTAQHLPRVPLSTNSRASEGLANPGFRVALSSQKHCEFPISLRKPPGFQRNWHSAPLRPPLQCPPLQRPPLTVPVTLCSQLRPIELVVTCSGLVGLPSVLRMSRSQQPFPMEHPSARESSPPHRPAGPSPPLLPCVPGSSVVALFGVPDPPSSVLLTEVSLRSWNSAWRKGGT